MSAPEFRALFNNTNFKYWFDKTLSNKKHPYSSFVHQTRDSSKKMIANSVVDFVLTKETLAGLIGESRAAAVFKEINSNNLNYLEIATYKNVDGQEQILFPELKFSTLNESVEKLLNDIGNSAGITNVGTQATLAVSEKEIHKGHVFGFGNTLINKTKEDIRASGVTNSAAELKALDEFIDALLNVLEEYDISTSDVKGLGLEANAKYRKTSSNWLIEWQAKEANISSGSTINRVLGRTGASTYTGARGVFTAGAQKNHEKIMQEVMSKFIQNFLDESVTAPDSSALNILNQKSSPSLKQMVVDSIASTIAGTKNKFSKEYQGSIKLPVIPTVSIKPINKTGIKVLADKLVATKRKLKIKQEAISKQDATIVPTFNLQSYIAARLADQIKNNMGTGYDKKVLNYRSGRLADSASIDRISQSRAGMVSVFYSYMRNPYGTFSTGGAQQDPASRDPKLLISKSIREIGASIVGNRMRAILV